MDGFANELLACLKELGFQMRIVSVSHLHQLQEEIEGLRSQGFLEKQFYEDRLTWFSFQVPESGIVSLEAPGDFNNQMALFLESVAGDSLILLAANDDYLGLEGNNAAAITGVSGLEPGSKCVVLIDGGGNGETGEFNLNLRDGPTGYSKLNSEPVRMYPNPASGFVRITGINKNFQYQIISIDGRILKRGMVRISDDEGIVPLDISGLSGEMHLLRIENEDGVWMNKLLTE